MSATIVKENAFTAYLEERKSRVAEITKKHSQKLFGYSHASIGEIRAEAVKRRLEAIFSK